MSSEPPSPTLVLYEHPVSSYAQKLKIALREKSLPFMTLVPPDLSLPSETSGPLHRANPRAEVPMLIHRHQHTDHATDADSEDSPAKEDVTLFDSTVILEYLEDRFPDHPPLMPPCKDAAQRAQQRLIENVVSTHYEAVNWGLAEVRWYRRASGDLASTLEANGAQHTKVLQTWLEEKLGNNLPFFAGEQFGWADCAVAPIVNRSVTYGLGPEEGSRLAAWHKRIRGRESVRKTFEEYEAGVAKMPAMADAYRRGGDRKRQYRDHRLEWMIKAGGMDVVREGLERGNVRFNWPDNSS